MTFIIAEAGVNHNGNTGLAFDLIDVAKEVGADAVKFQIFDAEKLEPPGERREMLRRLQFDHKTFRVLKKYADDAGIEFLATPFDIDSLMFLKELGCRKVKIGSGAPDGLLDAAGREFETVIMSTGMRTWDTMPWGMPHDAVVLHCVSSYPCPIEDANLLVVADCDGFSDHTLSTVIPAAAVALGAQYIEKHLTLDRGMEGPDHMASLEPAEFRQMVNNIREVELALGDGQKRIMPCEEAVMKIRKEREAWRQSSSAGADTPAL